MEISVFTSGQKTLIGKKNGNELEVKTFDSRLIFQDPDLVHDRFLVLLDRKFGIKNPKEISRIVFGLSGIVHTKSGSIVQSYILNELSNGIGYGGFSFKNCFGNLIGADNIYVVNDAVPIGLGFQSLYPSMTNPVISILIDMGVGVSVITDKGEIIPTELASDFVPGYNNKTSQYLLSHDGIDKLLFSKSKNILMNYTQDIINIVSYYREKSKPLLFTAFDNSSSKLNVCILSNREEFIDEELLQNNNAGFDFYLPKNEEDRLKIPLLGLFAYPDYKKPQRTILRIEYYSGNEKIYTFENYDGFTKHWSEVKTFANPDNEYRVFYTDGLIIPVKMRGINYKIELETYKF
jgi:hypothetical protein